jgi:hypothetical protein
VITNLSKLSEKKLEYQRQYRIKNKNRILEYNRQYRLKNPDKVMEYNKRDGIKRRQRRYAEEKRRIR